MSKQMINDAEVEVMVIAANGTTTEETLTAREAWTVQAVDTVLRANAEFRAAYPEAILARVDSNRGVQENRQGRYYLRYQHRTGATEFWGYLSPKPKFDFKKGVVGVLPTPDTPKP